MVNYSIFSLSDVPALSPLPPFTSSQQEEDNVRFEIITAVTGGKIGAAGNITELKKILLSGEFLSEKPTPCNTSFRLKIIHKKRAIREGLLTDKAWGKLKKIIKVNSFCTGVELFHEDDEDGQVKQIAISKNGQLERKEIEEISKICKINSDELENQRIIFKELIAKTKKKINKGLLTICANNAGLAGIDTTLTVACLGIYIKTLFPLPLTSIPALIVVLPPATLFFFATSFLLHTAQYIAAKKQVMELEKQVNNEQITVGEKSFWLKALEYVTGYNFSTSMAVGGSLALGASPLPLDFLGTTILTSAAVFGVTFFGASKDAVMTTILNDVNHLKNVMKQWQVNKQRKIENLKKELERSFAEKAKEITMEDQEIKKYVDGKQGELNSTFELKVKLVVMAVIVGLTMGASVAAIFISVPTVAAGIAGGPLAPVTAMIIGVASTVVAAAISPFIAVGAGAAFYYSKAKELDKSVQAMNADCQETSEWKPGHSFIDKLAVNYPEVAKVASSVSNFAVKAKEAVKKLAAPFVEAVIDNPVVNKIFNKSPKTLLNPTTFSTGETTASLTAQQIISVPLAIVGAAVSGVLLYIMGGDIKKRKDDCAKLSEFVKNYQYEKQEAELKELEELKKSLDKKNQKKTQNVGVESKTLERGFTKNDVNSKYKKIIKKEEEGEQKQRESQERFEKEVQRPRF